MRTRSTLVPNFKLPLEKITIHATFGLTSVDDQVLGRLSRAEDRVDAGHIPATRRDARVDDGQQLLPRRHAPVGEPRKGFGVHLADPRRLVLEAPRSLVVPGRLTPVIDVVHVVEVVRAPAAPDLCRLLLPHKVRLFVDDNASPNRRTDARRSERPPAAPADGPAVSVPRWLRLALVAAPGGPPASRHRPRRARIAAQLTSARRIMAIPSTGCWDRSLK